MKNTNKGLGALITGTLMAGALLGTSNANELFSYSDLGSGSELRADLLDASNTGFKSPEGKCGEAKADEKSESKADDSKAAEHKCGEGKCGEAKADMKPADSKAAEHKCGEGKAEMKMEEKDAKSDKKAKAVKPN
ncbi:hypothetical protein N9545_03050 [Salibacteraceae bacterium]|jgi:uncharacterized low-complexity protein|nr:hypothetical protein [Salibacteraceae bacterium]MDB9710080.1 hypothetical protein [Salibacteraceae bacterium]MDC1304071.1 hypothetical protein [Salibacteraceae bacterium]HAQ70622.1 hypothetical protein [Flavobacteriales bacterium]